MSGNNRLKTSVSGTNDVLEARFTLINQTSGLHPIFTVEKITDFLHEHLDQYGDSKSDIGNALKYALDTKTLGSGLVVVGHQGDDIIACVVINETGMKGYIPENILVYIAVHKRARGAGLGRKAMEYAIKMCSGDIALHVEKDNPARFLYEKLGFTNPYLEMRLKR